LAGGAATSFDWSGKFRYFVPLPSSATPRAAQLPLHQAG